MNHKKHSDLPAPCLVENGIVVHKADIQRLLQGLSYVRYIHRQDREITNEGEGRVMEVFCDPMQATLIANRSLYINTYSFDYAEIITKEKETTIALVQDDRCLCLIPKETTQIASACGQLDAATLEAIVAEALSASWDASLDDDRSF